MKKQLQLPFIKPTKLTHGGELAHGKRKIERPLKMNRPIHLVLRAKRSGLKIKERKIREIIKKYGDKFKVKIYQVSVNSNHLHLALSASSRMSFQNFLRSISGVIAKLMGKGKLWLCLAFTRVSHWGRDYKILLGYIRQNQLESIGAISYKPRSGFS